MPHNLSMVLPLDSSVSSMMRITIVAMEVEKSAYNTSGMNNRV
jgi:hypothetical protein